MRTFKIKNQAKEEFEVALYAEGKRLAVTREIGGLKYVLTHKETTAAIKHYVRLKDAKRALEKLDNMRAWNFKSLREWNKIGRVRKLKLEIIVEEALCSI